MVDIHVAVALMGLGDISEPAGSYVLIWNL
jgi:hypothetical protein